MKFYFRSAMILSMLLSLTACVSIQHIPQQVTVNPIDDENVKKIFYNTLLKSLVEGAANSMQRYHASVYLKQDTALTGVKTFNNHDKNVTIFIYDLQERNLLGSKTHDILKLETPVGKDIIIKGKKAIKDGEIVSYDMFYHNMSICTGSVVGLKLTDNSFTAQQAGIHMYCTGDDKDYQLGNNVRSLISFKSIADMNNFVSLLAAAYPDVNVKIE